MLALESAPTGYLSAPEVDLHRDFLRDGQVIRPVADRAVLDRLRAAVAGLAAAHLGCPAPGDPDRFLNDIHHLVEPDALNALKLAVIEGLQADDTVRRDYFELARPCLELLVGNELAMQRRLNLSVQLPGDDSALLPVHADVWDGDSPFEVVLWLPLVDCHRSKSMYLLPPAAARRVEANFERFDGAGTDELFEAIQPDVVWLDVPYGRALLFSQNLMHGNVVNAEAETRWSMNCRFKSLFSPYAGKRLGEFFEPITIRAATRLAMSHQLPGDFDE